MPDQITFTVLEDGTIKTDTDKVSMPNHASAASFLENVGRLLGGTVTIVKKAMTHSHLLVKHEHKQEH